MKDLRDREVYEDICRHIAAVLSKLPSSHQISPELAADVALAVAEHIRKDWGGQKIYFSKAEELALQQRDLDIYNCFNGRTSEMVALARQYDLSEERIRQIITMVTKQDRARRQDKLF